MARFARPLALLLALVLLLSASGAATRCVEADGTTRVELFSSVSCCADLPAQDAATSTVAPTSGCGSCDDQPLDEASWSTQTHEASGASLLLAPAPLAVALLPALSAAPPADAVPRCAAAPPRLARPSTLRS